MISKHNIPDFETEANKSANNNGGIHDVPQVAEIRARVEQDAEVHDLQQHLHSEHTSERVVK